jgi:hypothetical protein
MSLREELGGAPDPEFTMLLPPGWERHAPTQETLERFTRVARGRMMEAGRPELFVELRRQIDGMFAQLQEARVVAFFAPLEPHPDTLFVPASLTATFRAATSPGSLDAAVRTAMRQHDAQPLLGDARTIVFERQFPREMDGTSLVVHSRVYMTPVPGTERSRALQLVAGFGRPADAPADGVPLRRLRQLFDVCVSTLRWAPAPVAR